ncbi:hypothetical protein [Kocuria aegyptia]|uniref:hypothetical protein n=1 Tax=Kocuria aegyptia TaxID=330943 RepID=UPI0031D189D7
MENQVRTSLESAPPALASHYARIQLLVDSYGEDLTAYQSSTAGPAPREAPRLDNAALEESLEQIRAWLTDTCQDRR